MCCNIYKSQKDFEHKKQLKSKALRALNKNRKCDLTFKLLNELVSLRKSKGFRAQITAEAEKPREFSCVL